MRNSAPGTDLKGAKEASLEMASLPWHARVARQRGTLVACVGLPQPFLSIKPTSEWHNILSSLTLVIQSLQNAE